ncbi:MAG: type II toxin-antitoxin system YafQ family toxin [Spirochaetaceae bacterium]|nr:type II toxin-antitoxin system YafQ family toxin [Spirochaetaceae bacterium]
MYKIKPSTKFKKDIKRIQKSGRKKSDFDKVFDVINQLALPAVLPEGNKDHSLIGNYNGYRECHVLPDLLLIYKQVEEVQELHLYRIGSHSELF